MNYNLSILTLISFFAMFGMNGCSKGGSHSFGSITFNTVPDSTTPTCPDINWYYSDHLSSQGCIRADNYDGGNALGNGLQVAGVCSGVWTNKTTGYTQLEYSDVIIDCASGNVMSSTDPSLTTVFLPAFSSTQPARPTSPNDLITYTVTCYAYGEQRAQNSYDYTSTATCSH